MKLAELLEKYPEVKIADRSVNAKILKFFDETPMKGTGLQLRYERAPDFFKFLDYQSKDYFVFYAEKENQVMGVGTLVIRPGMIHGENVHVGYLGDLRVKFDKRLAILWRRFYGDLMENIYKIEEFHHCKYLLTAIIDENVQAVKALVHNDRLPYKYIPKAPYQMVNILMKAPLLGMRKGSYKVRKAHEIDKESINLFLERNHHKRSFGFSFNKTHNELDYRLKNWNNFDMSNMVIVEKNGNLLAVTGLWTPSPAKKIVVESLPKEQEKQLKFLSPFTKIPKVEEELKVQYMTLLTIEESLDRKEKQQVFRQLVLELHKFKEVKNSHMLAYADFPTQDPLLPALKGFVHFETPMTLYQVVDKEVRDRDEVMDGFPPGFEMALV